MRYLVLAGTILAVSSTHLAAAQSTSLEPLVVTGSRTPTAGFRLADAITVIDRDTILASQANSLAELLSSRAGIEVLDFYGDGSRASFGMRGFGENAASNTLVLIDGQPLNNPDIANPDLARIRLEDLERIEVLEGGSALWGNQAVGGVIHLITREAAGSSVHFERGSYASQDARARAAVNGEHWKLALSGSNRQSDNYREHNRLRHDRAGLEGSVKGRLAKAWVQAEYSDEELQVPGGLFADEVAQDRRQSASAYADDFSALRTLNLRSGLSADIGPDWHFDGRVSRYAADGRFRLSSRGFASDPSTQERRVISLNPQWTYTFALADQQGHFALGADLQRADYRLESQFGVQSNDQKLNDLYLSSLLPLLSPATLSLALRHSRIEDLIADPGSFAVFPDGKRFSHDTTSGSAGLNIPLHDKLSMLLGWDQVLRYPKVDEYFGSGFTPDAINLEPQTGDNYEVGLRLHGAMLTGSLIVYRLDLNNEIVYDPNTFTNINLDQTTREGVNAQAQLRLGRISSVDLAYSYIDARIDGTERIPLVAQQHAQISFNLNPTAGLHFQLQVQGSGDRLPGGDTDGSQPPLPGYGVVNLAARWQRDNLEIGLKLANVLDKHYAAVGFEDSSSNQVASFPLPEFNGRISMRYDLP